MTTIVSSSTTGLVLNPMYYANPVVINPGVTITSAGAAVAEAYGSWVIQNYGMIAGTGALGVGVLLGYGSSVTNAALGSISGTYRGVELFGAAGTVVNYGSITGTGTNRDGVALLDGGSVTNGDFASITGGAFGVAIGGGPGFLVNDGSIASTGGFTGVVLSSGGSVTNAASASIRGAALGLAIGGGAGIVVNYGSIVATGSTFDQGGYLSAGVGLSAGSVTNAAFALISGYEGIYDAAAVVNFGSIAGNTIHGIGVRIAADGGVTNQNGGTISGYEGIYGRLGAGTVVNDGSIAGTGTSGSGVVLLAGGSVTNTASASITGAASGVGITRGAGTVVNDGSIAGTGTSGSGVALAGGSVTNAASASITGGFIGAYIGTGTGTVSNDGSIAGSTTASLGAGVSLDAGGLVANAVSASIRGFHGVRIAGGAGTVVNDGSIAGGSVVISGFAAIGVALYSGGLVTNADSASITGFDGVVAIGAGTVFNNGSIAGNGDGGVYLSTGGSVTNAASASITGGFWGVEIAGGVGTVVNGGRIARTGTNGYGLYPSSVGLAAGFGNRVVVDPGAAFIGTVNGGNPIGAAAVSTLELATGASAGTVSGLGTQFINFAQVAVDGGANWMLTGYNTIATGETLTNNGLLAIGSSGTLSGSGLVGGPIENDGQIIANGGTLDLNGTVTGAGVAQIDDNATLELGGSFAAGGTVSFAGTEPGTLILDDLADFHGTITNLQTGNSIFLNNIGPSSADAVIAATIGTVAGSSTGQLYLQVAEAESPYWPFPTTPQYIPISTESGDNLSPEFFEVAQSGSNTVLTLTGGDPIADAVSAPDVFDAGDIGSGITVGVISIGDETVAMLDVVEEVAPGATVLGFDLGGNLSDSTLADAIRQLQGEGCQIIVDDLNPPGEPNTDSLTDRAIDSAVQDGVTYVTSAGNKALYGIPIFAHHLDPNAITVAAINWLAAARPPSLLSPYLPSQPEAFSSYGPVGGDKPDITAPDGGPTSLSLLPAQLNPFFGTSAAAPAVAGVAALMLSANPQLEDSEPGSVKSLLKENADPISGALSDQAGAGEVDAERAVAAATDSEVSFFTDPQQSALYVASAMLSQPTGDATTSSTIQMILTMSEAVTVSGGTPAFTLNDGGISTYDTGDSDPTAGRLVFDYTVGTGDSSVDLTVTGFDPNGATITDGSGSNAGFSSLFNVPTGLSINSPLTVTSAAASQTGEVQAGQTVQLTLGLNEAVTVDTAGGNPTLMLNDGGTATYDANASDPSVGKLVFDYTIGTGDATQNLSVFYVDLPTGTTVQDADGNNANFTGALNQDTGLQIGPAFVSLLAPSQVGAIGTGQTVQLTLTMSEGVVVNTSVAPLTLTLNDGGTATYDPSESNPSAGTLVFDYTVTAGQRTPSLKVTQASPNGASVTDGNGVNVDFSLAVNAPIGLTVNSPLVVTSIAASPSGEVQAGQTVELTLNMSEATQVDTLDNFGGPPTLSLNDNETATYDAAASTATRLVFDYVVQLGDRTPDLTITGVNPSDVTIQDASGNNADFSTAVNAATGVEVGGVPCFATGTRIVTAWGEVAVEELRIGDTVLTVGGEARPIVWIGTGRVLVTPARRSAATPILVCKGALADNVPRRDLRITKGHSLFLDDVLIPAEFLINHRSILWDDRAGQVEFYHIELATHDVLLANGAPAESYRDDGNRWLFRNANTGWEQPPKPPCAPVLTGGAIVDSVWRRLLDRAGPRPGLPLTDEPDLHLLADGCRIDGSHRPNGYCVFDLQQRPNELRVVSRAGSPAELGLARDPRVLGVAVRQVRLWQGARLRVLDAQDESLVEGFHAFEADNGFRWTDGDAALPATLFADIEGACQLELLVGGAMRYPLFGEAVRRAAA